MSANLATESQVLSAPFIIKGQIVEGHDIKARSRDLQVDFVTPSLDMNAVVTPRSELPPLLNVPIREILDFLDEAGRHLELSKNTHLQECLERVVVTNPLPRRVIENLYAEARHYFRRDILEALLVETFGSLDVLDDWVEKTDVMGNRFSVRAFPPRMIHMLAGNSPAGCVSSIAQGACVKAVNLFKMPSSDPFTCVAILRTMAEIDPSHPVVQSMSAVYWRGGDEQIERTLYRPQYFDRIVAWGGGEAIQNVIRYLGPGIQLVSFDPKTSISVVGKEGFSSAEAIEKVAEATAADVSVFNQEACLASRFTFVETDTKTAEQYCRVLAERLNIDRITGSAKGLPLGMEQVEEIEVMSMMEDEIKVFGDYDGSGLVILSDTPVDFHPTNKTINVVPVKNIQEAVPHVNVATQTVGFYPPERKKDIRDALANAGAQRVCELGAANQHALGTPHDAMYPFQRFVLWVADESVIPTSTVITGKADAD